MLYTRKKWSIFALLKHMCRTAKNVKILHSDYDLKPFFNVLMTPSWFCWKWHKNTHTKLWNKTTDFWQCQLIFIFKIRCLKARKPWLKVAEKKTNQTFLCLKASFLLSLDFEWSVRSLEPSIYSCLNCIIFAVCRKTKKVL